MHSVPEGYVGIYWRGGALLPDIAEPGFHLKLPLVTQTAEVQVTVQVWHAHLLRLLRTSS